MVAVLYRLFGCLGEKISFSTGVARALPKIQMRNFDSWSSSSMIMKFLGVSTRTMFPSLCDVKESLYAARYGGVDVDDLEANIRDVLS